ncbi:MAG: Rrf2 family transcriptional regulator [Deltaproteobacteria bacterium]|nr:Rrf2 family transcriptional regulator [Deltaproteobacteria bacterium]
MKLSTRTRYGLRALVELAAQNGKGPVIARSIAENQDISKKYLDNIFTSLRLAGLVRTVHGATGGYLLAHPPESITVANVIMALEGEISPVDCIDHPDLCNRSSECVTRPVWEELRDAMLAVLERHTIAELAQEYRDKQDLA